MRIRFSSLFFPVIWPVRKWELKEQKFHWLSWSLCLCVWPQPIKYFERPSFWHKVCCKGNDIICSKKGRAEKVKEVVHCICWRRIQSSYRLEQDCMDLTTAHRMDLGICTVYLTSLEILWGQITSSPTWQRRQKLASRLTCIEVCPVFFLVLITFKRILCRVHQDGGKTLINLTMYLFHTLFLASSLKANSFSLLPAGIL